MKLSALHGRDVVSKLDPRLQKAAHAHATLQFSQAFQRHGKTIEIGDRQLDHWEARWVRQLGDVWPDVPRNVDALIKAGHKHHSRRLTKSIVDDVYRAVVRVVGGASQFVRGAYQVYMDLATDTSEDAAQHTLDLLGLNATWKWANPRTMARDMFAVEGSKIIQKTYGNHIETLRKMIIAATDPAEPKTQGQIRKEIKSEWGKLRRYQIERLARTESANVWETTNLNVEKANGVEFVEWLIARGPSIGSPKSYDVCEDCLKKSVEGPYAIGSIDPPPLHPNCRCTLIPSLEHDWLPPAEAWTGMEPGLPTTEGAPSPV